MSAASQMLDIPEVRARISPLSVADYHRLPELNGNGRRTELIRGIVIEKMSKSPLHTGIASHLYDLIRPQIPPGYWLRKEEPLTLGDSEPEPDLSIVVGQRSDFSAQHPTTAALVVEIAVTSIAEDRALVALYAEAGVEEYWIILPRERQIEVHRKPQDGRYLEQAVVRSGATLACGSVDRIRIALSELFDGV